MKTFSELWIDAKDGLQRVDGISPVYVEIESIEKLRGFLYRETRKWTSNTASFLWITRQVQG